MAGLGGTRGGTEFKNSIRLSAPIIPSLGVNTGNYEEFTMLSMKHTRVTAAQIAAMNTTPVLILATPTPTPLNRQIIVRQVTFKYNYLTAAYTGGGAINLVYGAAGTISALAATVAATFLTSPAANQIIVAAGGLVSSLSSAVNEQGLYLTNATAAFATGAGSVDVYVDHIILPNTL